MALGETVFALGKRRWLFSTMMVLDTSSSLPFLKKDQAAGLDGYNRTELNTGFWGPGEEGRILSGGWIQCWCG